MLSRQIIVFVYVLRLYSLSPFKRPFPDGSGLAGTRMSPFWILLELRMTEMVSGDSWSYRSCKAPVKYHHQQTNTQFFYRPDALPVIQFQQCQTTEGNCSKTVLLPSILFWHQKENTSIAAARFHLTGGLECMMPLTGE